MTHEATNKIVEITKGYPFLFKQLCKIVYDKTNKDVIELSDVENCIDEFYHFWTKDSLNQDMKMCRSDKNLFCNGRMW